MITLTASIDIILPKAISLAKCNVAKNNISGSLPFGTDEGTRKTTKTPFILGSTNIGEYATLEKSVNYYIGSELSDNNWTFKNPYVIEITTKEPLNSLTLAFDTEKGRHPRSIDLKYDNEKITYYDDDSIYTIVIPENTATSYTVEISNWNAPNAPLVISGIYVKITLDINKRNLISLNSSIFDRSDYKTPSYGIISNTGYIEFSDMSGEIRDYAEAYLLTSNLKASIKLNETILKKSEEIGYFETKEWNYDSNNRKVSVTLKDNLEEWQNIQIEGFVYDPRQPNAVLPNQLMADLYKWLYERTPQKYNMIPYDKLDQATKQILENTFLYHPLLKTDSLWRQWQKLCEACALYIYKNMVGETVCSYTYGS